MQPTERRAPRLPAGLWRLTWAEWRAHPWRQLAALLSVAMGVALALTVHLINESALAEFSSAVRSVNGEPDLSLAAGPAGMSEALLDLLAEQPGVRVAHPRIEVDTLWLRADGRTLGVRVMGVDALTVMGVAPELLPQADQGAGEGASRLAMLDPALAFVNPALARELAGATELSLLASTCDWPPEPRPTRCARPCARACRPVCAGWRPMTRASASPTFRAPTA